MHDLHFNGEIEMKKIKKYSITIIGILLAFGNSNVFAAGVNKTEITSIFADVPVSDWSYGALEQISKDGIIDGYADGKFNRKHSFSRFELASIVANARTKQEQANDEDKDIIQKLSREFQAELGQLEQLDRKVIQQVKHPRQKEPFTVWGTSRVRYEEAYTDAGRSVRFNHIYMNVNTDFNITDHWTLHLQNAFQRSLQSANTENVYADGRASFHDNEDGLAQNCWAKELSLAGPIGPVDFRIGRWNEYSLWGHGMDGDISVIQLAFGNKLRTTIQTGHAQDWSGSDFTSYTPRINYNMIRMSYQTSKATKVEIAAYKLGALSRQFQQGNNVNYGAFRVHSNFAPRWSFDIGASRSNATLDKAAMWKKLGYTSTSTAPAWAVRFTYGTFNREKPKSYDVFLTYHSEPYLHQYGNTDWWKDNAQGFRIGGDYVLDHNVVLWGYYTIAKDIDTGAKRNAMRVELDTFF